MSQLHTEILGKRKKLRKDRVESRGPSKAALSGEPNAGVISARQSSI